MKKDTACNTTTLFSGESRRGSRDLLMPTKETSRLWRAVAPIGCGALESTCLPWLMPLRKLTKKDSSSTDPEDLWVRLGALLHAVYFACLRQYSERLVLTQKNFTFILPIYCTGYLLNLKDMEMALAIEVCLKGQLHAFTCDNYEDEKVLQGLMARVFPGGRRPVIITSEFLPHIHDTRRR